MNPALGACPDPELLKRLGNDSLNSAEFESLESHVEHCVDCQAILDRISSELIEPPPAPPEIPGFVIERELGRGGMGVVYQAWQPELSRRVALKFLARGAVNDAIERRRWLREAQAMGRIRHPHVVRLYEVGEAAGRLYLVLDLIPGGSLKDRIDGPVAPEIVTALTEVIARTVGEIHARGMLHLDIKPSNILLDGTPGAPLQDALPVLADFGLARAGSDHSGNAATNSTISLVPSGTPAFMAPEQFDSSKFRVGPYTDVFAVGATLYALLTGRSPFQGASLVETLDLVRNGDPVPPRTLVPGISRDLETAVLKCLRTDVADRYESAIALADDLKRIQNGETISARPARFTERAVRWCKRRPAVALLCGLLATTITISLVGLTMLWRNADAQWHRAEEALDLAIRKEAMATQTTGDIVTLLTKAVEAPQRLTTERTAKIMAAVSEQTRKLCELPELGVPQVIAIAELEREITMAFNRQGKLRESLSLLQNTKELIELHRDPSQVRPELEYQYAIVGTYIASTLCGLREDQKAVEHIRWVSELLPSLADERFELNVMSLIYDMYQKIAARAFGRGDAATSQQMLEATVNMADEAAARNPDSALMHLFQTIARYEARPSDENRRKLRAACQKLSPVEKGAKLFKNLIELELAHEVVPDPLTLTASNLGSPEECAARILAGIRTRCEEFELSREMIPIVALRVSYSATVVATEYRNLGQIDEAEYTAKWLEVLARRLTDENPAEAKYHLQLCRAFEQHCKNGWKREDMKMVERSLRAALAEAKIALNLDPEDKSIRQTVAGLQDKLIGVVVDEPEFTR